MRVDHNSKEAAFLTLPAVTIVTILKNTAGLINQDWRLEWGSSRLKGHCFSYGPRRARLHQFCSWIHHSRLTVLLHWCFFSQQACSLSVFWANLNVHLFFSLFNDLLIEMCTGLPQASSHFFFFFFFFCLAFFQRWKECYLFHFSSDLKQIHLFLVLNEKLKQNKWTRKQPKPNEN